MASYSIVLNLAGNAQERLSKLSRTLQSANAQAKQLQKTLVSIGAISKAIDLRGLRIPSGGITRSPSPIKRSRASMPKRDSALERERNYTRHKSTHIASWGTGFSFGPFTGRLSTILQPDSKGQIFGMSAAKFASRANIFALVATAIVKFTKLYIKTALASTAIQLGSGAAINMGFNRLLMSEGMAQGVRMIQRRNQARMGLGSSFLEAQNYADAMARDYGLERSASLASLNVLSGLRVGGSNKKLSLQTAASLTRVGGLISQQAGVSFERVMTNIQQLMTQSNPNIRDIRELLNQAPILGRYALDEMEKKGITGVDKNTYLKDQSNLLSVLQRYDVENMSSSVMQARGMVELAQQDFYTKLAENQSWLNIAGNTADLLNALADAISNLLTAFTSNPNFQNAVNSFTFLIQAIAENSDFITEKTGKLIATFADKFGIDVEQVNAKARKYTQQRGTIMHYGETRKDEVFAQWVAAGGSTSNDPEIQRRQFETWWASELQRASRLGSPLLGSVAFQGVAPHSIVGSGASDKFKTAVANAPTSSTSDLYVPPGFSAAYKKAVLNTNKSFDPSTTAQWTSWLFSGSSESAGYANFHALSSSIPQADWDAFVAERIAEAIKSPTFENVQGGAGAEPAGSDLTGFNRDRRSLEIHFHDAIVEWNSTINTDDPQDVVNEVSNTIEGAASRAIQIALLGASQKMNTRWY